MQAGEISGNKKSLKIYGYPPMAIIIPWEDILYEPCAHVLIFPVKFPFFALFYAFQKGYNDF